jgi:tumor protein p53-inducible protein 3
MALKMMRAVEHLPPGLISNMQVVSTKLPELRSDECLLKIHYTALNRADLMQRRGLYDPPPGESAIMGLEAAGVIARVSTNPNCPWKLNDRVMALLPGGGYAEFAAVNEAHLLRIPDWMSMEKAAAIPEAWLTAFQLLFWISSLTNDDNKDHLNRRIEDASVLVHAGASGVGTSLVQLLKNVLGVKTVYCTVGSEEKKKFLENELGVNRAFNYKNKEEENFDQLIKNITGPVDVIFDCVGPSYWLRNLEVLRMDGEWILYGLMGAGQVGPDLLARLLRKRIHLKSTTLRTRSNEYKQRLITEFGSKILGHFETGKLKVIIEAIFKMDDIQKAHEMMEANKNIGKILINVAAAENATNESKEL